MPHSIRDHLRYQFSSLEKGFMTIVEYVSYLQKLALYATYILPTEYEQAQCFV